MNSTFMLRTFRSANQHSTALSSAFFWIMWCFTGWFMPNISVVWQSHLHWTFNPCQWHHIMPKTVRTNHPVIWHNIPVEHTNQLHCCWNLKAHKGRPLFTTGLGVSCYSRQQVENYSLLQGF